jgi:flagellar biosynthetic protein FliP
VVFHFLRQALGSQQMPPNQILIGLALFLTFFVMAPVWGASWEQGYLPYERGDLSREEAIQAALDPPRAFMLRHTREKDLRLFLGMARLDRPETREDVPLRVLVPAFVVSELKTAFEIGFLLFLPFLVLDLVISSVLLSMGMMMLPPVMISLPFKILLFAMVDGWSLLAGSLVQGYAG